MTEKKRRLELVGLLYGEEREIPPGEGERLERWAGAFERWLAERKAKFSSNVGEDSYNAWVDLLAFSKKAPRDAQSKA